MSKKHAHVITMPVSRVYGIALSDEAEKAGFKELSLIVFERFRAAQDIANTIHTATAKHSGRKTPAKRGQS